MCGPIHIERKRKTLTNGMCLGAGLSLWLTNGKRVQETGLKTVNIVTILFSDASCAETAYFGRQQAYFAQ